MGLLNIFDKFKDTIVLKEDSLLQDKIDYLNNLKEKYPNSKNINSQLYMAEKGLAGEREILYQLSKANIGMYVLHDLNIVYEDLKAQIDFVIITPWCAYFAECKNLIGNITVTDSGDFIREYSYKGHKVKKGIESPYRQVQAQRDVYRKIWTKMQGKFRAFIFDKSFEDLHRILVVAANGGNILNVKYAPKDMKYNIIKADALIRKLEYDRNHSNKDYWSGQKEMERWANIFLQYNVKPENKFEIDVNESEDENQNEKNQKNVEENTISNNETSSEKLLEIRKKLIEFRKTKSKEKNIPAYYIFNNDELDKILVLMPKTKQELANSKILTEIKIKLHGEEIINIINGLVK